MGLSAALATAMSGLRANQAALSITSGNIANAQTPGYVTQNANQIEVATGGDRRQRSGHRRQSPARSLCPEPVAHGDLRRRLRRPDVQYPEPAAKRLRPARGRWHARNVVQQLHDGVAGAIDQSGQPIRADHGAGGGAIAGADAELDDAGHPGAAIECPAGYRHVGDPGQHRHEPDRHHQLAAAGIEPDRSRGRDADGSARQRDQRSVEIGGRSRCHRLVQSGQRLHDFRHATGRRPARVDDEFHFAGVADGEFAVQHQRQPKRRRIAHDPASERRQLRHGREQYDHVRARSRPT